MKANEVHKMSDAELVETVGQLRSRLFELRTQSVTEKLENPKELGNIRRDIARVLTEKRTREIASTQESN
ncbi:50S ribosomal protein L29 [Algisphaera agarilytica]|uniref:Large ribosomal subunit protein uL29 n=1 Tax=Algisphaera agarilytica TaxID=1385975 RepID=A0A7X0HAW7_9BACT|nr:50S ribosomal protein L29 [Algisphaera agarilytica]MBB6431034.1 large subunit ribosomal protein L29 [Algisphaera agarilytica]